MAKKTIRYGIIGCGGHAIQSHLIPGNAIPGLELVMLYDPVAEAICNATKYTKSWTKWISHSEKMYTKPESMQW